LIFACYKVKINKTLEEVATSKPNQERVGAINEQLQH